MEQVKAIFSSLVLTDAKFSRYYAIKKRIFPIDQCLDFFPQQGILADLGCGNGLFAALIGLRHPRLKVIAIDDDNTKIDMAKKMFGHLPNIEFFKGNITHLNFPQALHFSLIDVLYLIPFAWQEKILEKIAALIPDNGTILIKEMDKKPYLKYFFNFIQEIWAVKILNFTLGNRFYFRSLKDWVELLTQLGFSRIENYPMHRGYCYPHFLLRVSKR